MLSAVRLVMSGGVYVPPMLLAAAPGAVANNGHRNLDSLDALRELLTERQIEVLRLLSQGKPNKSIARDLNISEGTVKIHLAANFRAQDVRNRGEAVVASRKLAELSGREPGAGEKRGRQGEDGREGSGGMGGE